MAAGLKKSEPTKAVLSQEDLDNDPMAMMLMKQRKFLRRLGGAIRDRRRFLAWSQEDLGERSALSSKHVREVEMGDVNVSVGALCRIAAGLNIPLAQLVACAEFQQQDFPRYQLQELIWTADEDLVGQVAYLIECLANARDIKARGKKR